jgi:hypothetical protein
VALTISFARHAIRREAVSLRKFAARVSKIWTTDQMRKERKAWEALGGGGCGRAPAPSSWASQ